MTSRIKRANTGQWVSLCSDLARNPKTTKNAFIISYKPERVTTNTQAVLRLAWGGLAKGNQSCKKPPNTGRQAWGRGLGASRTGASTPLGPGLQSLGAGLGAGPSGLWRGEAGPRALRPGLQAMGPGRGLWLGPPGWGGRRGIPPPVREKRSTLSVTETIQHAPQGRRIEKPGPTIVPRE